MLRLIERFPETLFLIRPHPGHGDEGLLALRRDNVRFLDEACCVTADIPLSRIIPLVDQVVAPISTVVLDGPFQTSRWLYTTGNSRKRMTISRLCRSIDCRSWWAAHEFLADAAYRTRLFRNAYAEAVDTRFYERFALLSEPPAPAGAPDVALAMAVSLTAEVELQWSEVRGVLEQRQQSRLRTWRPKALPPAARPQRLPRKPRCCAAR